LIGDGMARISSRQQNHNNMPEETLRESGRGAFGITRSGPVIVILFWRHWIPLKKAYCAQIGPVP